MICSSLVELFILMLDHETNRSSPPGFDHTHRSCVWDSPFAGFYMVTEKQGKIGSGNTSSGIGMSAILLGGLSQIL